MGSWVIVDHDLELPVFPVRNGVLFPGMAAPFDLGRPPSRAAVDQAQTGSPALVLVVTQRKPETEEPLYADVHPVGCIAEVLNRVPHIRGGDRVILHGQTRVVLRGIERLATHLRAKVSEFPPDPPLTHPHRSLVEEIREGALLVARAEGAPPEALEFIAGMREPSDLVYMVAGNIDAPVDVKVRWLGAPLVERIKLVLEEVRVQARGKGKR